MKIQAQALDGIVVGAFDELHVGWASATLGLAGGEELREKRLEDHPPSLTR
jgi:hypothetical protein